MNGRILFQRLLAAATIVLLTPALASATVRTVRQDGSGGYLTILAAYGVSSNGDTIDVGPGTYAELLDVTKRIAFIGSSGAAATILDGEDARLINTFRAGSTGSSVAGFTYRRGYGYNGGALRVQDGCAVAVRDCIFEDNVATYDGAAFFVRHSGSHLTVEDCVFRRNHSAHNGGAGQIIEAGTLDVARCVFHDNSTDVVSGGLGAHFATMNVSECLFHDNATGDVAGAVYYYNSAGAVRNCTFYGNTSPGEYAGTVMIQESPGSVVVERNIIAGERATIGLYDIYSDHTHTCNVFWANAVADIGGNTTYDPSEIVNDPLFCDAAASDFSIAHESPAAPANNGCGVLVGAYAPACNYGEPCDPHRWFVRKDGSGDFMTIADAVAAAGGCDTIDVGPGTYAELLDVTKRIAFIGSSGAAATILDGENAHQITVFGGRSAGSSVAGFTYRRGYGGNGAALRVHHSCAVAVRDCIFEDNVSTYDGAAFFVRHPGSRLTVEDCVFRRNHSAHNGGAGQIIDPGTLDVARCVFHDNSTDVVSGGLGAHLATMNVSECLFNDNATGDVAGAVYYYRSAGAVRNCTFYGNTSPGEYAGTVMIQRSPAVVVERNIIAGERATIGLYDIYSYHAHTCNMFWENAVADIGGHTTYNPTEIVCNPLFCDAAASDFGIAHESLAAPANNGCGVLMGAYAPACYYPVATLLKSFSAERRSNVIEVRWSITENSDCDPFTVSRSIDGAPFEAIPDASIEFSGAVFCFSDGGVEPGKTYRYRVAYSSSGTAHTLFETNAISMPALPLTLYQNYPNPFNPATSIRFYLPNPAEVKLEVFDVSGRRIALLAQEHLQAGSHTVEWQGMDDRGTKLASGTYFCHMRVGSTVLTRKMILLR